MTRNGDEIEEPLTSEDVELVARIILEDESTQVLEYELCSFTGRLGLLGDHRELTIIAQRKSHNEFEKLNLFVKSLPYDVEEQAKFITDQRIFEKESSLFGSVIPELVKNYKGEKWSPTCYFVKKDSLVMEDLKTQGYRMMGKFFDQKSLLQSALAALARLHGCSILTEHRLSLNSENSTNLKEYYPDSFREIMFNDDESMSSSWFSSNENLAALVAERLGHDPKIVRKALNRVYDFIKPSSKHQNVICHGDLWTNNMMFDDTKPIAKCVLVDFQLARYAPLVLDILQLFYLSTSQAFRINSENDLIRFYHSVLVDTVKSNDLTNNVKVPTLEQILTEYDDLRLYGAIIATMYFPMLLDPGFMTELTSEEFQEFFNGDRTQLTLSSMEKNEFFKSKFEEVINELAEIGMKL